MNPEDRQPTAFRAEETAGAQTPTYGYVIMHPDGTVQCAVGYDKAITVTNLPAEWNAMDPQTFAPSAIKHGSITATDRQEPRRVNIMAPVTDPKLRRFLVTAAPIRIAVYIVRFNAADVLAGGTLDFDTQGQVIESGILGKYGSAGNIIQAELTPQVYFQQGDVPRFHYSRRCNNPLFSKGCGLDRNNPAFLYETTIASLDPVQREMIITGQKPGTAEAFFSAGQIAVTLLGLNFTVGWASFDGSDTKLKLTQWHPELEVGQVVVARAGCLHTVAACTALGNVANFGGFPHVPNHNPTVNSINP